MSGKKYIRSICSFLLVFAVVLTACGGGAASSAPSSTAPGSSAPEASPAAESSTADAPVIKIGALLPLTGDDALDGQNQKRAHDLAVEEINAEGGIKSLGGAKVEIVYGDSQGKPEIGNAETERLITQENVVCILGAYHSGVTVSAMRICERYKVPFVVPNALSNEITELGMKYTFKTVPKSSDYCRDTGDLLTYLNENYGTEAKKIAIIRPDAFIGQQMGEGWEEWLPKQGYEIVAHVAYPPTSPNLQDAILKLKAADPDVVMSQANAKEAILIIKTMKELNWWPKYGFIGAGGGYSDPNVVANVGELAEDIYLVNDWFPKCAREGSEETNQKFRDLYGVDMTGNANTTYAGTWVVKEALELAASADRDALFNTLRTMELTGGKIGFMYDVVKFAEDGLNEGAFNVAAQVRDGEALTVWPEHVRVAEPIWPVPNWDNRCTHSCTTGYDSERGVPVTPLF